MRSPELTPTARDTFTLTFADEQDRQQIYRLRHDVYAREIGQHAENAENAAGALRDPLDEINTYLVARKAGAIVGFIAITPPGDRGYSIDKYFARTQLPFAFDEHLFEVRLLTVVSSARRRLIAPLLMYAALEYVESRGGRTIVAIGRSDLVALYERAGLRREGLVARAGAVTYELMSAAVGELRRGMKDFDPLIARFATSVEWKVPPPVSGMGETCVHGGAFWNRIGASFGTMDMAGQVIAADVLDAWFDPAPGVISAIERHLPFLIRTSPPTDGEGMRSAIARARGIPSDRIVLGAGSSELMFTALRLWITPASRVLLLDPMYGEYIHLVERVIGARVDRLTLTREAGYQIDAQAFAECLSREYDWILLVNPNSPTGRFLSRDRLTHLIANAPATTRFWIDETYVDFVGGTESLESYACASTNVVVAKSMSKAFALSGLRAAYLCGAPELMTEMKRWCPPWAVSLPGQVATCEALAATDYYRARWNETAILRGELQTGLEHQGWRVVPGVANFLMCHTPPGAPDVPRLVGALQERNLFIRSLIDAGECFRDAIRIAVKNRSTNERMLALLEAALRG